MTRNLHTTILSFFFIISCLSAYPDNNKYLISGIASEKGLSNSAVLTIYQDKDGLMWFGTYDGLNCYDSNCMDVFRSKSPYNEDFTFKSNIIHKVCQADSTSLWVKTYLGIGRFSIIEKKIEEIYPQTEDYQVYSNFKGDTWVVKSSELLYFNTALRKFVSLGEIIPKPGKLKNAIVAEDGGIWLMYAGSPDIISFKINSFSLTDVTKIKVESVNIPLHNVGIDEYYVQYETFSFIDSEKNLFLYDMASNTKVYIRNVSGIMEKYGNIENVIPFKEDVIIAFTLNGLVRLNFTAGYAEEVIDRSIRVFAMAKDRYNEILWVGTDGQGVLMLTSNNSIAKTLELTNLSPLLKRQVRCISTDKHGGLWVGTKGDGLIYIPEYEKNWGNRDAVELYSNVSKQSLSGYVPWNHDKRVFSINESRFHDGMWIGGTNSNLLFFYSFKDEKMKEVQGFDTKGYEVEVKGIYEENENTVWVSMTALGLVKLKIETKGGEIKIISQDEKNIVNSNGTRMTVFYSMINQGDSVLWLGDRGKGLVRYNIRNNKYKVISLQKALNRPVDDILSICRYDDSKFYIGTSTGMVSMKYLNDSVTNISYIGQEHGLSNDMLHGVLADKNGFLWMSSNKGLNKYNPMNGRIHTFYGNGINISEFSDGAYYKCPYTGRLFFGGVNGLLYLSENTVSQNTTFQDIVLRDFWRGNERTLIPDYEQNGLKGWKIDRRNGYFRFRFIVPDFVGGENIEYSHILEGYDKEWSLFSKTNDVTYSNVPSGKYVFKVRYKKDINENNEKILSIPVRVTEPWYSSSFMLSAIIVIVLLIGIRLFTAHTWASKISILSCKEKKNEEEILQKEVGYEDVVHYGVRFAVRNEDQKKFMEKLVSTVENNLDNEGLDIPFLASELNMSTRQFYRKFNELSADISPNELVKLFRLEKAAELLKNTDMSVMDILSSIGISSRSYFYKEFTKRFGTTPKDFRSNIG